MTLWAASARAELCVDVDLHFSGHAPEPELRAAIEQETTAIWAPYGVNLRWQVPACDVSDVSFDVFVARRLPASSPGRAVLGSTHVQLTCTDKVPIVIDAAVTEKTLGSLTMNELMERTGRLRVGPQELGRAFGRVLAHEIGHVILGLPNHQREGLMRRAFHPIDMVSPLRSEYGLSSFEISRLRHRADAILTLREHTGSADAAEATPDHCYHQRATEESWKSERVDQELSHAAGARPGDSFRQ